MSVLWLDERHQALVKGKRSISVFVVFLFRGKKKVLRKDFFLVQLKCSSTFT